MARKPADYLENGEEENKMSMEILSVNSPEFKAYGRIIENVDFAPLLEELKKTPVTEKVAYKPSVEELENTTTFTQLTEITYGEIPIQIGYCNGHNSVLTALEYHKDSEVNVMATDAILLLGLRSEIEEDFTFDSAKVKAFLVPAGMAVEVYATSLHYAPCGVDGKPFQVAIVLPKGTNYPITKVRENRTGEDAIMTATNKWLLRHPERLKGELLSVL